MKKVDKTDLSWLKTADEVMMFFYVDNYAANLYGIKDKEESIRKTNGAIEKSAKVYGQNKIEALKKIYLSVKCSNQNH